MRRLTATVRAVITRRAALRGLAGAAMLPGLASAQTSGPITTPPAIGPVDGATMSGTITGGAFEPIPISVPRFVAAPPTTQENADIIAQMIASNLERSGMFRVIPSPEFASIDVAPDFATERSRGVQAFVAADLSLQPDGRIGLSFRLWDIQLGEQRQQLKLLADPTGLRRIAHKVSDVIYSDLTGELPYFDSRVAFIEEKGPKNDRTKTLAIIDQDGAQLRYLTAANSLILTPRFAPTEQLLTYISYETGQPAVYLMNLTSQTTEGIGAFPGMTFAPRFSPDSRQLVMSLIRGGATDIWLMDLATRRTRQLTQSPGIDTAPSFSPDGQRVAFESDRGSTQQLYIMNADGSDQRRISFGEGRYATPVWSPIGDYIAFTKMLRGRFHIGVIRPDGTDERLLTSSFLDEGPTWAPNGRVIMYFRETPGPNGRPQLYTVDIFGRAERLLKTQYGASDPAWSPLLS